MSTQPSDQPAPKIGDDEWQEYVHEGIEAVGSKTRSAWVLGDIALKIETRYGERNLQRYAEAVGERYKELLDERWLAERITSSLRREGLSKTHYEMIAGNPDVERWVNHIEDLGLSTRQLEDELLTATFGTVTDTEGKPLAGRQRITKQMREEAQRRGLLQMGANKDELDYEESRKTLQTWWKGYLDLKALGIGAVAATYFPQTNLDDRRILSMVDDALNYLTDMKRALTTPQDARVSPSEESPFDFDDDADTEDNEDEDDAASVEVDNKQPDFPFGDDDD